MTRYTAPAVYTIIIKRRRRVPTAAGENPSRTSSADATRARAVNVEPLIFYKTDGRALTRGQYRVQCQYQRNRRVAGALTAYIVIKRVSSKQQFLDIRHDFRTRYNHSSYNIIIFSIFTRFCGRVSGVRFVCKNRK